MYILTEQWNRVADGVVEGGGGIQCPSGVLRSEGEAGVCKHREEQSRRVGEA